MQPTLNSANIRDDWRVWDVNSTQVCRWWLSLVLPLDIASLMYAIQEAKTQPTPLVDIEPLGRQPSSRRVLIVDAMSVLQSMK